MINNTIGIASLRRSVKKREKESEDFKESDEKNKI